MQRFDLSLDVTDLTPYREPVRLAGTLFAPADGVGDTGRLDLLVCLHGGSCSRSYYHPDYLDASYSFAEYMTGRGFALLTLDNLGMGESSAPEPEASLQLGTIAAANDRAVQLVLDGLREGQWLALADRCEIAITGIGHSIGGMLAVCQQGRFQRFDRLAVVGWTNIGLHLGDADTQGMLASLAHGGYVATDRANMRSLFHLADVPSSLIATDDAHAGLTPATLAVAAFTPAVVTTEAAAIGCAVMLVYGEIDVSPDPQRELSFYPGAAERTLLVLPGAAHMHNFAGPRRLFWQALADWAVAPTGGVRQRGEG